MSIQERYINNSFNGHFTSIPFQAGDKLQCQILLEHHEDDSYSGYSLTWPHIEVKSESRTDTLEHLRKKILERLARIEIVTLEIDRNETEHPWLQFAGDWDGNDPRFQDFQASVDNYRREVDAGMGVESIDSDS